MTLNGETKSRKVEVDKSKSNSRSRSRSVFCAPNFLCRTLKSSRDSDHAHYRDGLSSVGLHLLFKPYTKSDGSTITCNEEIKGNAKCKNSRFEPAFGDKGVYTSGRMVRDAPWRKLGGFFDDNDTFARVYNNLLLHEYIYYFTLVCF